MTYPLPLTFNLLISRFKTSVIIAGGNVMPNEQNIARPCRADILLTTSALLACAAFYLWLRAAPADAPRLLLAPVSRLAGALCGMRFDFVAGTGYCGWSRDGTAIIIEKSCSGGNFGIILFSLLVITQPPKMQRLPHKLWLLAGILLFSLLSAIAASALRIAASVPLLSLEAGLSPVLLHNIIGIATYLTAVCLCFLLAGRLVSALMRADTNPLFESSTHLSRQTRSGS